MYSMMICVGMLTNMCTQYHEINFPTQQECQDERREIQRAIDKNGGWVVCRPTEREVKKK